MCSGRTVDVGGKRRNEMGKGKRRETKERSGRAGTPNNRDISTTESKRTPHEWTFVVIVLFSVKR